ncbi:MAG: hypothetical protein AAGG07_10480 [Planctomycetota bacterium]
MNQTIITVAAMSFAGTAFASPAEFTPVREFSVAQLTTEVVAVSSSDFDAPRERQIPTVTLLDGFSLTATELTGDFGIAPAAPTFDSGLFGNQASEGFASDTDAGSRFSPRTDPIIPAPTALAAGLIGLGTVVGRRSR